MRSHFHKRCSRFRAFLVCACITIAFLPLQIAPNWNITAYAQESDQAAEERRKVISERAAEVSRLIEPLRRQNVPFEFYQRDLNRLFQLQDELAIKALPDAQAVLQAAADALIEEVLARYEVERERIEDFAAVIEVRPTGDVTVTEKIRVRAGGLKIKRGIFRDFRKVLDTGKGRGIAVNLDILSVLRDGKREPHRLESQSDRYRLYIGQENRRLKPGSYLYEIRYRMDRQILFGTEADRLIWNVTGNYWSIPIEKVRAIVRPPSGAKISERAVYTGYVGLEDNSLGALISQERAGPIQISLDSEIRSNQGLTVAIALEPGVIARPTQSQLKEYFWRDHKIDVLSMMGFALVVFYYLIFWIAVGRDPRRGVVVPRWDLPKLSPALVNYIVKRGLKARPFEAVSSALVNLSVKGLIRIEGLDDTLTLVALPQQNDGDASGLPPGERALYNQLTKQNRFALTKANGASLKSMMTQFRKAIENEHRGDFFKTNQGACFIGVGLSILVFLGVLISNQGMDGNFLTLIASLAFGVFVLVQTSMQMRNLWNGENTLTIIIVLIVGLPMLLFAIFMLYGLTFLIDIFELDRFWPAVALAGLIFANFFFWRLMEAPTPTGRAMLDHIEGLKQYLKLAEQDRMNLVGAPTMSPQHFETLLPYAMALELEKPWSQAFEAWLYNAEVATTPVHSQLGNLSSRSLRLNLSQLSTTFASQAAASLPVPKSSSTGLRGGFSGGGGGGLGGGGW